MAQGQPHAEGRAPTCASRASRATRNASSFSYAHREPVVGGGRRPPLHARAAQLHDARAARACRPSPPASRPVTPTRGSTSSASCRRRPASSNYDRDGNPQPEGDPVRRALRVGRVRVLPAGQLARDRQPHADRRPALQPVLAALRGQRPAGGAQREHGRVVRRSARPWLAGIPSTRSARSSPSISAGPKNGKKGYYEWDKNNFAPRVAFAWTPSRQAGRPRRLLAGVRPHRPRAWRTNFDVNGSLRPVDEHRAARSAATTRTNPAVRFQGITSLPPTMPARAAGRVPADAAEVDAGTITQQHRRHADDAVRAHVQRRRRPRASAQLERSKAATSAASGATCWSAATWRCR